MTTHAGGEGRWHCGDCGAWNPRRDRTCRTCGEAPKPAPDAARADPGREPVVPLTCPADRTPLGADGYCPRGGGYAATAPVPFACPHCRHRLGWSGECMACHGTPTGRREDWTFPGARYDFSEDHWRLTEPATGRAVCPPEDSASATRALLAMLAHRIVRAAAGSNGSAPEET